jgi:hypothetical protein
MGNIATGNLPAACEHLRVLRWDLPSQEEPYESRQQTRLVAEPLDAPENFRLKIITAWDDEPDFLLLEEVVNRRQFTEGFAYSLKKFLDEEYQLTPDNDGKIFDLRTLPLAKLSQP